MMCHVQDIKAGMHYGIPAFALPDLQLFYVMTMLLQK